MNNATQAHEILLHLQRGLPVTPMEALRWWGCFRLSARVLELRAAGHKIATRRITTLGGKRVASYSLEQA